MMKRLTSFVLGSALMIPLLIGCAAHGTVVVGTYGPPEAPYYTQWERETHRDHVNYERRKRAEQREYWAWRKNHRDHD